MIGSPNGTASSVNFPNIVLFLGSGVSSVFAHFHALAHIHAFWHVMAIFGMFISPINLPMIPLNSAGLILEKYSTGLFSLA